MVEETKKYKVLVEFPVEGGEGVHAVDSVIELTEEVAASFVADGKLELVTG